MIVERQLRTEQIIKIRIETTSGHLARVLCFQCAGSGVARIGEKRFLVELALAVKPLESAPGHENLAADFEKVGPSLALQLQGNA